MKTMAVKKKRPEYKDPPRHKITSDYEEMAKKRYLGHVRVILTNIGSAMKQMIDD